MFTISDQLIWSMSCFLILGYIRSHTSQIGRMPYKYLWTQHQLMQDASKAKTRLTKKKPHVLVTFLLAEPKSDMNVDVSGTKFLQSPVPMKSHLSVNCNNSLQVLLLYLYKQLFKHLIKWLIMHCYTHVKSLLSYMFMNIYFTFI